ncbi:hypothetical protein RB195_006812 [Necator americanus]|uniref:Endonuclease/exonuclease/phosphatase domain-containing protein n=1 Tax=Necator americanus TaxID=51031 RepID=A0ABR1BXN2_NECAM
MRGLPARGRSRPKNLVRHRQKHPVRLARLNETRWKGSKSRKLGGGCKLIYHGTSNRNGVGIILNESFRNSVTAVDRLSDRLMAVKLETGEVELRVVSAYAPQVGSSKKEKACFWEDLEQYVQSLEGEEVLLIGGDFNGHVSSRKDSVMRLTAESTLGKTTLGKTNTQKGFWNEDVQAAICEKKSKYKLWWRTRQSEDRGAYLATKSEAKKAVSKAKSDRYKAVQSASSLNVGHGAHQAGVLGAGGAVLHRFHQILERWREYYNRLCNEEFCYPPIRIPSVEGPVLPITAVEVSDGHAKMKWNKETGPIDITTEVWKLLGDQGSVWLATLSNKIVAEGRTPDVWQTSVTVPVWKEKGDIADCTSYRPIRLLCHTMKVFERVLEARLRKIVSVLDIATSWARF